MGSYVRQRSDVQFAAVRSNLGVSAEPREDRPLKSTSCATTHGNERTGYIHRSVLLPESHELRCMGQVSKSSPDRPVLCSR